jgi:hypothetical protein
VKEKDMKKKRENEDDDILPEYDFSKMRLVARGPGRKIPESELVHLAPDVAQVFPDEDSVNEALRLLIRLANTQVGGSARTRSKQPHRA